MYLYCSFLSLINIGQEKMKFFFLDIALPFMKIREQHIVRLGRVLRKCSKQLTDLKDVWIKFKNNSKTVFLLKMTEIWQPGSWNMELNPVLKLSGFMVLHKLLHFSEPESGRHCVQS